jgi:hypothetical protein
LGPTMPKNRPRIPFGPLSLLLSAAGFISWRLPYVPYPVLAVIPILALLFAVIAGMRGRRWWFIATLFPAFLLLIFASDIADRNEYFHTTLTAAKQEVTFQHGWIPIFLPESSHDIHVLYYISGSETWCAFDFSPADRELLERNLQKVDAPPAPVNLIPPAHVSWWPGVLDGNLNVDAIHRAGFTLYVVMEPDVGDSMRPVLFAIDWSRGRGFMYRV